MVEKYFSISIFTEELPLFKNMRDFARYILWGWLSGQIFLTFKFSWERNFYSFTFRDFLPISFFLPVEAISLFLNFKFSWERNFYSFTVCEFLPLPLFLPVEAFMLFLLFKFSCERNFYSFQFCEVLFALFYMRLIKVEDHSIYNSERIASLICQLNRVVKMISSLRIADASSASQINRELKTRRAKISAAITNLHQSKRTTSFVPFNKDKVISWRDLHKAVNDAKRQHIDMQQVVKYQKAELIVC